ncbi:hypothetical protein [Rheinheimera sp.]|uniref:hypothetical protein n=1 Tax=Rheinheimera sp. TaxID=1869214 RepID=UPI002FDCB4C3
MNTNKSNKLALWDSRRGHIVSRIGKWVGGQDVQIRQYSLLNDLFLQKSYMQVLVLNATGRLISAELGCWLENNFMVMSYPDARIWCNQIGAFAGELHSSPTAATAAGCLAADSRAYGGSLTSKLAMEFIQQARLEVEQGVSIEQLVARVPLKHGKPAIIGFARPVARHDERIEPHRRMTAALGFTDGPHLTLANQLSDYLLATFGMGINIGGYTAAFMSDQGFSPDEVYRIKNLCVASGVMACYVDQLDQTERSFLALQCADISYQGHPARTVPLID